MLSSPVASTVAFYSLGGSEAYASFHSLANSTSQMKKSFQGRLEKN